MYRHKVECKYYKHVFAAGASRIREHFLHIILTWGVAKCTAHEAVLQPVLYEIRAIDAQNKAAGAAAAEAQRQLDRSITANASTSSYLQNSSGRLRSAGEQLADLAERTQALEQGACSGTSMISLQRPQGVPGQ